MNKSTVLPHLLASLTAHARGNSLTDSEWARQAGVRKETLSRLRGRNTCDLTTLLDLADVVGMTLGLTQPGMPTTPDDHFPAALPRDAEARLLALAASGNLDPGAWTAVAPRFFMAGLAVMLGGEPGWDRRALLELAETLHPGASEPAVFARWLQRSPLRPSRFLPLLAMQRQHAA
jgi:hypothetical protein